jgi:hypothetical protein
MDTVGPKCLKKSHLIIESVHHFSQSLFLFLIKNIVGRQFPIKILAVLFGELTVGPTFSKSHNVVKKSVVLTLFQVKY